MKEDLHWCRQGSHPYRSSWRCDRTSLWGTILFSTLCSFDVAILQHRQHWLVRMSVRTKSFNSNKFLILLNALLFSNNSSNHFSCEKSIFICHFSLVCATWSVAKVTRWVEVCVTFQLGGGSQFVSLRDWILVSSELSSWRIFDFYAHTTNSSHFELFTVVRGVKLNFSLIILI